VLEALGVRCIFGVPGEDNIPILNELRQSSKITYVPTRHENMAAMMAAGCGRLTGIPGVVMTTAGPGATNAMTGVAQAFQGCLPLVVITAQKPIHFEQYRHAQVLDLVDLMRPVTKASMMCTGGSLLASMLVNCFRLAQTDRKGPVHLCIPENIQTESVSAPSMASLLKGPLTNMSSTVPVEDPAFGEAVDILAAAKRPLLVLAQGSHISQLRAAIATFVDEFGMFFVSSPMGKGAYDETHAHWLGCSVYGSGDIPHLAMEKADMLLVVGMSPFERPLLRMDSSELQHLKVVHVSAYATECMNVFAPTVELVGDIVQTMTDLSSRLRMRFQLAKTEGHPYPKLESFPQLRKSLDSPFESTGVGAKLMALNNQSEEKRIDIQHVAFALRDALVQFNPIMVLDEGQYKAWLCRNYPAKDSRSFITDHAFTTMTSGLPTAIACALMHKERRVVLVVGDGALMMSSTDIETALRLNLKLMIVLVRDDAFGEIATKEVVEHKVPRFGVAFTNPDWCKLLESYQSAKASVRTWKVSATNVESLRAIFKEAYAYEGNCAFVDVPISYAEGNLVLMAGSMMQQLRLKLTV
jgi:acetolactate synthase-1/2/3 large subunit